ncbi:MAG: TIGR02266 family protein [Kofleriaceae bacterium]
MVDPNTRQGKRTPVTLKIKFKSETLEQFIERYAVDVSQGGIFIRTKEPLAVGTQMRFEFQLRDASPLIAGEGTVVWTRENDPSRPAIAPGMGVRFDRLAEGSQGVLERILSEKAKQAPQRPPTDTSKPPVFTDTPTRVAPAPVQEALLGNESGAANRPSRRRPDSFGDTGTPLPRPMPFHSDAEDFDEQAFEEATKVRALDELIAQTADAATTDMPADELASRRAASRDSTVDERPEADRAATVDNTVRAPYADRDSAPGLPSPPAIEPMASRPHGKILDTTPSPRSEASMPPMNMPPPAKTVLGLEPARASLRPGPSTAPPPMSPPMSTPMSSGSLTSQPSIRDAPTKPTGMRAAAAEPRAVSAPPVQKSGSIAGLAILLLLLVAAGGAAVWFFVFREEATDDDIAIDTSKPRPGSNVKKQDGSGSIAVNNTNPGSNGTNGSGSVTTGSNGSAGMAVDVGSGSAGSAGSAAVTPPKAELVDTLITASVPNAEIEVVGTSQKGPSPLKAKLEKGKDYKARVQAPGFVNLDIDVKGGEAVPKAKATLVLKKRIVSVTSDPPGAAIMVDNAGTAKTTPFDLELTPAQAARRIVRIGIRKTGWKGVERVIDAKTWVEDNDTMVATIDAKLEKQQFVRPTNPPNTGSGSAGSATTGTGSGSDANGAGTGSDTSGTGSGSENGGGGTQTPTPPAGSAGSGSAAPSGPSAGSTPKEPEPDFVTKP